MENQGADCLQVWDVNSSSNLLGEVVGNQAGVLELPAKDIGDDEDTGVLAVASNVGVETGDLASLADWASTPLETRFAALRHVVFD